MAQAKQRNTTAKPKLDPVAEIGRQLEALNLRYEELDTTDRHETDTKAAYRDAERKAVFDQIQCLRNFATTLHANSLEGALVHIALASFYFSDLCDNDLKEYERTVAEMRFHRLVYSAVRALSAGRADLDLTEIGVRMHLGEHLDPWVPHEKRVRAIENEKRFFA